MIWKSPLVYGLKVSQTTDVGEKWHIPVSLQRLVHDAHRDAHLLLHPAQQRRRRLLRQEAIDLFAHRQTRVVQRAVSKRRLVLMLMLGGVAVHHGGLCGGMCRGDGDGGDGNSVHSGFVDGDGHDARAQRILQRHAVELRERWWLKGLLLYLGLRGSGC